MIVGLPSGIGDFSWAYSKLVNAGPMAYEIADGAPYRTVPYLELLEGVTQAKYGADFGFETIVTLEAALGFNKPGVEWAAIRASGMERVLLQPNHHLERGKRLEEWLPDLPTTFHYPINTLQSQRERAAELLEKLPRPILGFSCASYRGAQAWKTWESPSWVSFLDWWKTEVGGSLVAIGGGWDDLTASVATQAGATDLVGATHIGVVVEILRNIEWYLGFSSGLGVIRTVLKRPVFMLWPDFQAPLSVSWAPPEMLELGTYATGPWREPEEVIPLVKRWLRRSEPYGD